MHFAAPIRAIRSIYQRYLGPAPLIDRHVLRSAWCSPRSAQSFRRSVARSRHLSQPFLRTRLL
jgi:hypothetical protein